MNSKPSIINSKRLVLQVISKKDADDLIGILTNKEVALTYMVPKLKDYNEAYKLFERIMNLSMGDRFVYGIYLNEKLIGLINEVDAVNESIELGYVISPLYKGKGYATEALGESIQVLFDMGCSVVKAGAFEHNLASIRVMEKCSMTRSDLTEEVEYNGIIHKCIMYSIRKTSE